MVREARSGLFFAPAAGDPEGLAATDRFLSELETFLEKRPARAGGTGGFHPIAVQTMPIAAHHTRPPERVRVQLPAGDPVGNHRLRRDVRGRSRGRAERGHARAAARCPPDPHPRPAGKALACFVAILAVEALLLLVGAVAFGVRPASPGLLTAACLAVAVAFVGLMMLISTLGQTERSASGAGWAILLVLSMLGGGMVPLFVMPAWMATASHLSPVKWAVLALEGALWRGFTVADMALPCAILLVVGLVTFAFGARRFQTSLTYYNAARHRGLNVQRHDPALRQSREHRGGQTRGEIRLRAGRRRAAERPPRARPAARRPRARIPLVERDSRLGGNHTWSFHEGDVAPEATWPGSIRSSSTAGLPMTSPSRKRRRRLEIGYSSLTSARLDFVVRDALVSALGSELCLGPAGGGHRKRSRGPGDGRVIEGTLVVDARGPEAVPDLSGRGYQKFLGLEVRLREATTVTRPLIMDATVAQLDGFRFVYSLPLAADRMLIEDTYYSDSPALDRGLPPGAGSTPTPLTSGYKWRRCSAKKRVCSPFPGAPRAPLLKAAPCAPGTRGASSIPPPATRCR